MQVKCSSCGASQIANQNNLCLYCGTTISSELKSTVDEISQIELALFEYKKGNFSKSSIQFDEILKHQPSVFIAWAYKIFSDFQIIFPNPRQTDFSSFYKDIDFIIKKANDLNKKKIIEDILIEMFNSLLNKQYSHRDIRYSFWSYIGNYYSDNRNDFLNIYKTFSIHLSDEFSISIINELINFYTTRGAELKPFDDDVLKIDEIISISPILLRDITLSEKFIRNILDVSTEYWKKRIKREADFMRDELPSFVDFKKGEILISSINQTNSKLNFTQLLIPFKENCDNISNEIKTLKSNETKDSKKSQNEKFHFQDLSNNKDLKKESKSGCFIATAAMGDYNHPVVIDLRLFRDNWLLNRNWGINFINWYYTHGPKAARVIEKSTFLRKITFIFIVKPLQLLTKKLR
jgi:hypothetical protein